MGYKPQDVTVLADGPAFCEVADVQFTEEPTLVTVLKTLIFFPVTFCRQVFQNLLQMLCNDMVGPALPNPSNGYLRSRDGTTKSNIFKSNIFYSCLRY